MDILQSSMEFKKVELVVSRLFNTIARNKYNLVISSAFAYILAIWHFSINHFGPCPNYLNINYEDFLEFRIRKSIRSFLIWAHLRPDQTS